MLIKARPLKLGNVERGREKTNLVLLWLLELRVASLEVLAARIGLKPNQATRFFKKLLDRNFIERIKVNDSYKRDLVILGAQGHKILGTTDIAYATELNKVRRYTKKKTIQHDLEVQKAALTLLPNALEIISEFNIRSVGKRPDLLVFRWNSSTQKIVKIAVEMEKSPKDSSSMYWVFKKYADLINEGEFDEVKFFFSNQDDLKSYVKSFEKEMWPQTVEKQIPTKKGLKTVPATGFTLIPKGHSIRSSFSFELLEPTAPAVVFKLEEAAELGRSIRVPYLERMRNRELAPLRAAALEHAKEREENEAELVAQQLEEEREEELALQAHRAAERNRVKERNEKIEWYKAELARAQAEDNSRKAWLPGYKFQYSELLKQFCAYLQEQLAIASPQSVA